MHAAAAGPAAGVHARAAAVAAGDGGGGGGGAYEDEGDRDLGHAEGRRRKEGLDSTRIPNLQAVRRTKRLSSSYGR